MTIYFVGLRSLLVISLLLSATFDAYALDVASYRKMAQDTIRQVRMGIAGDINALVRVQERLMDMGIEAGVAHLKQGGTEIRALQLVIVNAENMKELDLDEIESLWHQGNFLKKKGIDIDKLDRSGEMVSLMEAIIHPATAFIALNEYKMTGNAELLARIQAELIEVIEHVGHIKTEVSIQSAAN